MPRTNTLTLLTLLAMSRSIVGCTSTCIAQAPDRDALCQEMLELAAEGQPEGENGWPELVAIARRVEQLTREFEFHDETGYTHPNSLYAMPGGIDLDFDVDRDAIACTRRLLHHLRTQGVFQQVDAALSHPRLVPTSCEQTHPRDSTVFYSLGDLLLAQVAEATRQGDLGETVVRLAQAFQVSNAVARVPGLFAAVGSASLEGKWTRACQFVLREADLDSETLIRLTQILAEHSPRDSAVFAKGLTLEYLWMMATLYSDDGLLVEQDIREARDAIGRFPMFVPLDESSIDPFDLPKTFGALREMIESDPPQLWLDVLTKSTRQYRLHMIDVEGLRLVLAVHRHKSERGTLPTSLEQLSPQFIDVIPTDPRFGTPFGYKRLTDDPFEREFIIYSWGRRRRGQRRQRTSHLSTVPAQPAARRPE